MKQTAQTKSILGQLKKSIGGEFEANFKENNLKIESDLGQGLIKEMTFKGGISCLMIDMKFSETFEVAVNMAKKPSICFAYCSEGQMGLGIGREGKRIKLENFQTGILAGKEQKDYMLYFEKGVDLKMILILVNPIQNKQEENHLNHRLQKLFFKEYVTGDFAYVGSYNLKIAEKIRHLNSVSEKGIARRFMMKGLVHMILALEIQQHSDDIENKLAAKPSSLTCREWDTIRELSLFINNYSERPMSISYLCKKGGLSPSKLQEGFKLMHNTTVTNYIRDIRIQKAEDLIKNTDLNISEVVYSIGLISRSYFSKIFKAKYNCSPKLYREKQNAFSVLS